MSFPRAARGLAIALTVATLGCSLDRAAIGGEPDASFDASIDAPTDTGTLDAGQPGPLLVGEGSFMRGSEASFVDRAGTVRFVVPHARRTAGDTSELTLIEGARTNLVRQSQTLSGDSWARSPTCTVREDDGAAPDGTTTADRAVAPAGERCVQQTSRRDAVDHTLSAWFRAETVGAIRAAGAREAVIRATSSVAWTRLSASGLVAAPRFDDVTLEGRQGYPSPSDPAIAHDVLTWGWQLEAARFASSYIRTASESATRAADTWIFSQDDVDARLTTGRWQVVVEPEWTPDELDSAAWVLSFSSTSGLRFRRTGAVVIEAVVDGIPVATLPVPALMRGDELLVDVEPRRGSLAITHAGSTTSTTASPWAWAIVGDVRVGGRIGGEEELFGWITVPRAP